MTNKTRIQSQKFMDKFIKLSCFSILDELEKHPISKMFAEPVDPIIDEAPNYFDIVKSPMDFSTVRNKLNSEKYQTIQDFKNDVQLIFSNAALYNGKSSPVGVVAAELSQQFKELSKSLTDNPDSCWYNKLIQLKRSLINHVQQHPSNVQKQKQDQTIEDESTFTCEIGKFEVSMMSSKDLECLAFNLLKIEEPKQIESIIKIINEENPEVDTNDGATIDLNILTPQSLRKLKEFTINELEMTGKDYDEVI